MLHWPTEFYANQITADGVMTSYWFYKMAATASLIYLRFLKTNGRHLEIILPISILTFRLDRIYSFGDISIFIFWYFG